MTTWEWDGLWEGDVHSTGGARDATGHPDGECPFPTPHPPPSYAGWCLLHQLWSLAGKHTC